MVKRKKRKFDDDSGVDVGQVMLVVIKIAPSVTPASPAVNPTIKTTIPIKVSANFLIFFIFR